MTVSGTRRGRVTVTPPVASTRMSDHPGILRFSAPCSFPLLVGGSYAEALLSYQCGEKKMTVSLIFYMKTRVRM